MPTRNNDSSYITERRRAMALYAYNNALQAAQNANNTIVLREQPSAQSLAIITDRKQGGCFCSDINNGNVYDYNKPGSCGCRG